MAKETLADQIERERTRLNEARADAMKRRADIDKELEEIERGLNAANAYEAALTGKTSSTRSASGTRTRTPGRRDAVLAFVKKHADGVKRADILAALNPSGDKSVEGSISNAMTNMVKAGTLTLANRVYTATAGS